MVSFELMEFIHNAIRVDQSKHLPSPNSFLAESAGVHASRVSQWKKGETITLEQAVGIARALGVSLDALAGVEGGTAGAILTRDQELILATVEALELSRNEAIRRL